MKYMQTKGLKVKVKHSKTNQGGCRMKISDGVWGRYCGVHVHI